MAKDTQRSEGHKLKYLKAAHEIAGKGLDRMGRMWIHAIEGGTSYGAMSGNHDIAIINDYSRRVDEDVCIHFASICLDSLEADVIYVSETDHMVIFTPTTDSVTGVFGATVIPTKLPNLQGICEATSKHVVTTEQVDAVNKAFGHLGAKYNCVPVMLGSQRYMAFTGKGRQWSAVMICHASKTSSSVMEELEKGWLFDRVDPKGSLSWDTIPRQARRIVAIGLGLTKARLTPGIEEKLLAIDATKAFKSLSLDYIESVGREIGVTGKNATPRKILKILEQGQLEE